MLLDCTAPPVQLIIQSAWKSCTESLDLPNTNRLLMKMHSLVTLGLLNVLLHIVLDRPHDGLVEVL